jgi:hypothetical protein
MKVTRTCMRVTIAPAIAALLLTSCATTEDGTWGSSSSGGCDALVIGVLGAVLGAAAGAAAGGRERRGTGAATGAAIGGGVGALACVAYNYQTRQTKSAQQVTEEYKAANNGAVPREATVTRFDTRVTPKETVNAGNAIDVISQIEVVAGMKDQQPKVEHQIVLYQPNGKEVTNAKKPASQNAGGGAFEASFRFKMPEGAPQGVWPVKSQVLVNGQPAANSDAQFQVVVGPRGTIVALAYLH